MAEIEMVLPDIQAMFMELHMVLTDTAQVDEATDMIQDEEGVATSGTTTRVRPSPTAPSRTSRSSSTTGSPSRRASTTRVATAAISGGLNSEATGWPDAPSCCPCWTGQRGTTPSASRRPRGTRSYGALADSIDGSQMSKSLASVSSSGDS